MTYDDAVEAWFDERIKLGEISEEHAYKSRQKALLFSPYFGDKDLDKITKKDIVDAIAAMRTTGNSHKHGEGGFSPATMHAAYNMGKAACRVAIERGDATVNPFSYIKAPKVPECDRHAISEDDLSRLVQTAYDQMGEMRYRGWQWTSVSRYRAYLLAVLIVAMTGLRRGEVFALKWKDVDVVEKKIHVRRAVKGGYKGEGDPKSRAGIRDISIGKHLIDILGEAYMWQCEHVYTSNRAESYVCCAEDGKRPSLNAFGHWWRLWASDNGFDGLLIHELRHTHATLLIANGVDIKTVQTRLGHSSADITLNIYAHAVPAKDVAAADDFDAKIMGGVS